tara:strand:+ start:444 stop:743 length:300 start_codon:yes stop_codon:yes gene_type:complete
MTIVIIILSLIIIFISYICILSFRRLNIYEQVFLNIDDYITYAKEKLKILDDKGSFESDDEIGFVFEEIKSIQEELNKIFEKTGELDDGQNQDTTKKEA